MKRFTQASQDRLLEVLDGFRQVRVAVVGDFFLDKYLEVDPRLAETSVETGKPAHQVVHIRHAPGAAGTVVANLLALDAAEVFAVGLIGDDGEGFELCRDLQALGCRLDHLHTDPSRHTPTYLKPRDRTCPGLKGEHSRYDTKNRELTPPAMEQQILNSLSTVARNVDAVIVLDQVEERDCGVVTTSLLGRLPELAKRHGETAFWGDSRRRAAEFHGIRVKCNQYELCRGYAALDDEGISDSQITRRLGEFRQRAEGPVLATLGGRGILVSDPEPVLVPTLPVEGPVDPTGAGDSAMAGCVLAAAAGANLCEAALLGNLVASRTITQLGTTGTTTVAEVTEALKAWLAAYTES